MRLGPQYKLLGKQTPVAMATGRHLHNSFQALELTKINQTWRGGKWPTPGMGQSMCLSEPMKVAHEPQKYKEHWDTVAARNGGYRGWLEPECLSVLRSALGAACSLQCLQLHDFGQDPEYFRAPISSPEKRIKMNINNQFKKINLRIKRKAYLKVLYKCQF